MKILFDSDEIRERCNCCRVYSIHYMGKTGENKLAFKCKNCGQLTVWMGGDTEQVISPGTPPVGV